MRRPTDVMELDAERPVLLQVLLAEDMFLGATIVPILGMLTVVGILISDIL
ncbi:MAG: hypothetical protein QGI49_02220 [SAR202 cluster bacterium]|nr:hypothetical protein [SAR202 cluster bacterium]